MTEWVNRDQYVAGGAPTLPGRRLQVSDVVGAVNSVGWDAARTFFSGPPLDFDCLVGVVNYCASRDCREDDFREFRRQCRGCTLQLEIEPNEEVRDVWLLANNLLART